MSAGRNILSHTINDTLLLYSEFTFINFFDILTFWFAKKLYLFYQNPLATCSVNGAKQVQNSNFV